MNDQNDQKRKRVNISISPKIHARLQILARERGTGVSQTVSELVYEASVPMAGHLAHGWIQNTLARIELYAARNHVSPEQAVTDWAWSLELKGSPMKGQLSFL